MHVYMIVPEDLINLSVYLSGCLSMYTHTFDLFYNSMQVGLYEYTTIATSRISSILVTGAIITPTSCR